ncbi:MAG: ATP-dependent DNA helicase, partial [Clostridia bacterium]|nr:ATP-dependent DNA helicase [Clostridia bacterium]
SRVKIWCWNPSRRVSKAMKRMRGTILFSATLSPIAHYESLLSLDRDEGDVSMCLPSPFPKENLFCASLFIPTRYRLREESAGRVAKAIYDMVSAKKGNYLACFPSHAYLNSVAEIFMSMYPDVRVALQLRDMTEDERKEYLDGFEECPSESMVAFIAMGGVFSEGIDLPGEKLIGAAIVGVGLPQISFEGDCLKELYEEAYGKGFETAYVYPGAGKCLQAAGRVIRTETDKGAVLFIDDRYRTQEYRNLLAPRYTPLPMDEKKLTKALKAFWEEI